MARFFWQNAALLASCSHKVCSVRSLLSQQGGSRNAEEAERDRRGDRHVHSSTARAMQGTSGSRMRGDQMSGMPGTPAMEYAANCKH